MATSSSVSNVAPAPQPVHGAAVARPPTLVSGRVQPFRGYLTRRTKIVKRWKKNWIEIEPGEKPTENLCSLRCGLTVAIDSIDSRRSLARDLQKQQKRKIGRHKN